MAFTSSTDVKETVLPETVFGQLPTTGPRYDLPRKSGGSLPVNSALTKSV